MKRVHLIISGFVQGVGFRSWVRREAQKLGVVGWVKNRDDGAVEIVGEGTEDKLRELIKLVRIGPEVAEVTQVDIKWSSVSTCKFSEFVIIL